MVSLSTGAGGLLGSTRLFYMSNVRILSDSWVNRLLKNAEEYVPNQKKWLTLHGQKTTSAEVAQLVEHQLPKLRVAGSSPVFRSINKALKINFITLDFGAFFISKSLVLTYFHAGFALKMPQNLLILLKMFHQCFTNVSPMFHQFHQFHHHLMDYVHI